MEPKLPAPEINPGQYSYSPAESVPGNAQIEQAQPLIEQERARGEVESRTAATVPVLPVPIAIPVIAAPVTPDPQSLNAAVNSAPMIAGDDDLIEKEWVDQAKRIIAETRDDPHRREREVGRLQADYLKKRYGKDLGAAIE